MYSIINNHDPFEVIILFLFIFVSYLIKSGFLHKNVNKKKIVWDGFISTMQGFSFIIIILIICFFLGIDSISKFTIAAFIMFMIIALFMLIGLFIFKRKAQDKMEIIYDLLIIFINLMIILFVLNFE
jgi:hypothetical protein